MLLGFRGIGGGRGVEHGLLKHFIPIGEKHLAADSQSIICVIYT